jgi:hypothetical protein
MIDLQNCINALPSAKVIAAFTESSFVTERVITNIDVENLGVVIMGRSSTGPTRRFIMQLSDDNGSTYTSTLTYGQWAVSGTTGAVTVEASGTGSNFAVISASNANAADRRSATVLQLTDFASATPTAWRGTNVHTAISPTIPRYRILSGFTDAALSLNCIRIANIDADMINAAIILLDLTRGV